MDYRDAAKTSLDRAKSALDSGKDYYLKYAALELRMALESLVYERAGLYKEESSNKSLSTWQPKKLLGLLLDIDPFTDHNSTIFIGKEEEYGKPSNDMKPLGTERVLSLSEIKKYYDRLGSYLHTKTIDQVKKGKGPNPESMRTRCMELCEIIHEVVSSPIFNANIRTTSRMKCSNCQKLIVRRIPATEKSLIANCIECNASYKLTVKENNEVIWEPIGEKIKCANQSCNNQTFLFQKEIKIGTYWICNECKKKNVIKLALVIETNENI
jgi:hypothetical protein